MATAPPDGVWPPAGLTPHELLNKRVTWALVRAQWFNQASKFPRCQFNGICHAGLSQSWCLTLYLSTEKLIENQLVRKIYTWTYISIRKTTLKQQKPSLEKACVLLWVFNLAKILMRIVWAAARHQGSILHFWGALMSTIFIYSQCSWHRGE